jgi:hypothetical protein
MSNSSVVDKYYKDMRREFRKSKINDKKLMDTVKDVCKINNKKIKKGEDISFYIYSRIKEDIE